MTEEIASPPIPSKGQMSRAQAAVRDGRIFLAIAAGTGIFSGVLFVLEKRNSDFLIAGIIALLCLVVCGVVSFWKLAVADNLGLHTSETHFGLVAFGTSMCLAVLVAILYFFPWIVLPSKETLRSPIFWAVPALFATLWCFIGQNAFREDTARRSFSFFLLGQICFVHALVVVISNDFWWFPAGSLLQKSDFWRFQHVFLRLWLLLCAGGCCLFFCLGFWNLTLVLRGSLVSRYRRRAIGAAWVTAASLLTMGCVVFPFQGVSEYWASLAAIWSIAGAVVFGGGLARLGIDRQPSWLRQAVFICPFVVIGAFVVVPTVGILGAIFPVRDVQKYAPPWWARFDWNAKKCWVLNLPDEMRDPIARRLARLPGDIRYALYFKGLMPVEELRTAALAPAPGRMTQYNFCVWRGWHRREPDAAICAALAVPAVSDFNQSSTAYDRAAGLLIGRVCSPTEMRSRLLGPYSSDLVIGVEWGIPPHERFNFMDEIETIVERRTGNFPEWTLLAQDAPRAEAIIEKLIRNTTPSNIENLAASRQIWSALNLAQVFQRAFSCNVVDVRKIALQYMQLTDVPNELVPRVVEAAKGQLDNSDANEQRLAAIMLASTININTQWSWSWNDVGDLKAAIVPLTPSEKDQIDTICASFQHDE